MKVQYREDMANYSDPESCITHREVCGEALTGEISRPAIEPRNQEFGMLTQLSNAEGNTERNVNRKLCDDPTWSETLSMLRSHSHGSSEISSVSKGVSLDGIGKAICRNPIINAGERSDTFIVPKKQPNKGLDLKEVAEGRSVTGRNSKKPATSLAQNSGINVSSGLLRVRAKAQQNKQLRFTSLMHHITIELLRQSFLALKKDAAVGIDGVKWREYESALDGNLVKLHQQIQSGKYRAKPSRRVYIPKADGKLRPLGIASLEDKIAQHAIVTVLSAIYEQDFLGFSYGFRPGRGQHDALDALSVAMITRKVNWILDADIKAFFDEVDHEWMMRFLEYRIADSKLLALIKKWLIVGHMEGSKRISALRGTPQGAVISPLLANIYLHYAFDLWAHQWRSKRAKGEVILVRYADDSVMGFQYESDAKRFLEELKERLAKFKLNLHPDKTRLIRFGLFAQQQAKERGIKKVETFDFLGFTHCCGKNRNGRFMLRRLTIKKRMRATLLAIRETLTKRRHEPIPIVGRWLRKVVQGYFNYYAVPTNMYRLDGFRSEVCRAWRHALIRRSQRNRMTWVRFNRIVQKYLPPCRVVHPLPAERFAR